MIGAFALAALLMFIVVRLTAAPLERVGAGATPPAMGAPEVATLTPKHELGAKACSPAAMRETGVRSVRVKTALDHASSSVMIVDGEHRIVYANAALHSLFGALADEPSAASDRLPATAVVGRDFDEFHDHDSLRPAALDALEQELVARMTLGAHTLDLVVNPVVNDAGERLGTIVEWLDMSQLVAVEARVATLVADRTARARQQSLELEKALIRERELNLMQRQFVTMVSHEFRTPLSVIDGAAQLLMRRLDRLEPAEIAKRVGRIRGAVLRMTLTAASLSSGKLEVSPEAFDPRAVIRCCCQRQAEIAQQHRITADLEQLPSEAIADPRLVEQIFTNLLSNAVKYSPDSPHIMVRGWTEGHEMIIAVSDEGLGIPADELPRIFQRFFRVGTSKGISGTGVGLDLVKQFIELQDGGITVESTEGTGSTFTVRLPIRYQGRVGAPVVEQAWRRAGGPAFEGTRRSMSP